MQQAHVEDRGSYIEISLGAKDLVRGSSFIDILVAASNRFGTKPMLVICDDPSDVVDITQAYKIGVEISARLPFRRIAIALRGRKSSSADLFAELVVENRGGALRYFDSVHLAKNWLGI
jgi:hypothetical protein